MEWLIFLSSSNSISMLPSEPKIFHGRESELADTLKLFTVGAPRIAILGSGGMGKTSLARAILHHTEITARYDQHRFFVACDSTANKVELCALIGAHLGLKLGKDLTGPIIRYFSSHAPSLLILDNLETAWEPAESRSDIEEFLSLLTDVEHLALMVGRAVFLPYSLLIVNQITMRGAERPGKVHWTRPFLLPLNPLGQDAARQTFIDIAEDRHNPDEVDKVISLTDHMPLAINLLAHLVDSEGCTNVLSRWDAEKTSLISGGYDKTSNLDISISLSLSSPRLKSYAHSQDLLSLLSILPDGLSDVELVQSKLPIDNILGCKAALIRTALAYRDEQKRLKALVPIREHMHKMQPPQSHLIRPLLMYFQQLLELHWKYQGTPMSVAAGAQISSNFANIQNVLQNGLHQDHPDLNDNIYCTCYLNNFSILIGRATIPLMSQIHNILPQPCDHSLMVHFITELLSSWRHYPISKESETLVAQALEHAEQCGDPHLQCMVSAPFYHLLVETNVNFKGRLYIILQEYYSIYKHDSATAINFCETALSLAISTGNSKMHSMALAHLAMIQWQLGAYSVAMAHAYEAQRLARVSADLYHEACALDIQATCWTQYGHYKQSISICNQARDILGLCGLSRGQLEHAIMTSQAEVHKCKSEYLEARNIHCCILQETPEDQDIWSHALALLNLAEIDVFIDAPYYNVQRSLETARNMFNNLRFVRGVTMCDTILADLDLREGNRLTAKTTIEKCMNSVGDNDIMTHCLECVGDISRWGAHDWMPSWTTVFLIHSLKSKKKLAIHKALQFLGDIFLAQNDEDTAISLFTLALEGFTRMDVHCGRAECMLRLGNISQGHNDLLQAVEHWEAARPLFERSSQAKQVELIDERLASVGARVLEQHRKNLAHLAELSAPSGSEEEVEDEPSDIEDLEVELNGAKGLEPVAA